MVVRVAHDPHSSSKFTSCKAFPVSQALSLQSREKNLSVSETCFQEEMKSRCYSEPSTRCGLNGRSLLFATPWTVACQAALSMGFPRQEYWSGLPFPSPGYLPDPGIEPLSPALEADALTSEPQGKPKWEGNTGKRGYMYMYT